MTENKGRTWNRAKDYGQASLPGMSQSIYKRKQDTKNEDVQD